MLFLKAFILAGIFLLFHRLRNETRYASRSALIASVVWAVVILPIVLLSRGVSLPAFGSAAISLGMAFVTMHVVQFLDTTVFWWIAWPGGFAVLLFFA